MRQFYVFLVTMLLFSLYFLPAVIIIKYNQPPQWAWLYAPIVGMTLGFGELVHKHFHYLFDNNR